MKRTPLRKVSNKQRKELALRAKVKSELLDKGHVCHDCGRSTNYLDLHHVNFLSRGGKTEEGNVILLCRECHMKRHNLKVADDRQS